MCGRVQGKLFCSLRRPTAEGWEGNRWTPLPRPLQHGYFTCVGGRRRHHWHQQHGGAGGGGGAAAAAAASAQYQQDAGGGGGGGARGRGAQVDEMTNAFAGGVLGVGWGSGARMPGNCLPQRGGCTAAKTLCQPG